MNDFDKNFLNACAKMAKAAGDLPAREVLDNAGLDGEFLLNNVTNVMGQMAQEEHFAFGMLLGIFYEQLRRDDSD